MTQSDLLFFLHWFTICLVFLMFPVSFYTNQYENITRSLQNNCSKSSLCSSITSFNEGSLLFGNWLQLSCSVPACGVNANLMANEWSSDQGSLMATYAWLSNAVRTELLGAAAWHTHTPNYQVFFCLWLSCWHFTYCRALMNQKRCIHHLHEA